MDKETQSRQKKGRRRANRPLGIFNRFWTMDAGLTSLLIALFVTVFVMGSMKHGYFLANGFLTLVFLAGILTVLENRILGALCVILALTRLCVGWSAFFRPDSPLVIWDLLLSITFFCILAVVVAMKVFRRGPITYHNVCGAVVLYLLVGIVFTLADTLVEYCAPGSFRFAAHTGGPRIVSIKADMAYYSIVTLTSTGYGDIVPVTGIARSLSVLESIIGQLYPAIIIAWLVSLAIQQPRNRESEKRE